MRDSPAQVAAQVMGLVLYGPKHPYGYTELGTEASMKAVTRDEMMAFWRQHFIPNNAALIVAGDISMSELRALAEKAFASWPRGNPVQAGAGRSRHDARPDRHRRQAGRTADAGSRGRYRGSPFVA